MFMMILQNVSTTNNEKQREGAESHNLISMIFFFTMVLLFVLSQEYERKLNQSSIKKYVLFPQHCLYEIL